jgi:hypothetical protein
LEYGLKLKPKKCELFQKEVEFLGRVVGPRGIYIGPGYIKDIKNWPRPKNKKEVETPVRYCPLFPLTIAFLNSSNAFSCSSPH